MNLRLNPISKSSRIRVGITIGDPSGIGPGITAQALARLGRVAEFVIIGDEWVFNKAKNEPACRTGRKRKAKNYSFVDLNNINHSHFQLGKVKAQYGRASIEYIDKALELLGSGLIDCLVTAPICKEAVALSGLKDFRGHTEYLAAKSGTSDYAMLVLNKYLKFFLATTHIPLNKVSPALSVQKLSRLILLAGRTLKTYFALKSPRIAVAGLNPHASDNGLIGKEENEIIRPALKKLRVKLPGLSPVLPADVAVRLAKEGRFDCVIAMYHDQAMVALKATSSETGVNMTAGLPFVRTSPLHGTAFDLARCPSRANPASMIEAIKLAIRCSRNQKNA
jgi:4-hydroxythreonine-4-phosphate dehydrogenase